MKSLGFIALLLLGLPAQSAVAPSFSTGTVTSRTESTTTVTESIREVSYSTGSSYTSSGVNITMPGRPGLDSQYSITTQGAAFQFSETFLGPGISKETFVERTTVIDSVTDSLSVFSQ